MQKHGRAGWVSYAAGGVLTDDEERQGQAIADANLAAATAQVAASEDLLICLDDESDQSEVKLENMVKLKDGRKKFTEQYRPGGQGGFDQSRSPSARGSSASRVDSLQVNLLD